MVCNLRVDPILPFFSPCYTTYTINPDSNVLSVLIYTDCPTYLEILVWGYAEEL